jgi:ABC-2 type transport system ATP-binding protein
VERVDEVLEIVHMGDRADGYIGNLSKGMRQRVGLGQALLHEPEVLILDEPTIGLDPAQIRDVRDLIAELGRERTILLSTHILSEAQQVCNRVLIINKGRIVAEDTPQRLQDRVMGAQRISLKVGGDLDGLEDMLTGISGISRVVGLNGDYEIETNPGADLRPEIARAVVQSGFDLLEIRPIGLSLEDIFLQLTQDEIAPPDFTEDFMEDEYIEAE